ncbi:hypothetical protein [Sphingomonas sp. AX6]|uniref:hypothetical protein n=1 Tax=Sphingomonas sp. AX6 TaxID=2653171 RepID=UPI0012EFAB62|nr:hypothetical protein [Sphingomonas sp. AX6]VXC83749.1 hypothetical protein SPHINGOAX6_50360 [Sphingomonas sp. AX6]
MRCIRSCSHRASANLPFERSRLTGAKVHWRGAGVMAAIGMVVLLGIVVLPDSGEADTAAPVQIAQAPTAR